MVALLAALVAARAATPSAPVTYHEHVAAILLKNCAPCHRPGQSGPFTLLTYADALKHGPEIVEVTAKRTMPPWLPAPGHGSFVGERRLTDAEMALLKRWVDGGMPAGDPLASPPLPRWPTDWELGQPDEIVRMPTAYIVPADGRDIYRHFVLPMTNSQRRFVKAWEFRPHSRTAHHAFVRVDRSGEGRRRDALDTEAGFPGMDTPTGIEAPNGHFASWQPGAPARREPAGLQWTLEPGTDVVIQMHLQPSGKPEPMQAELGLYYSDQPPTNQPVKIGLVNYDFDLPAGANPVVVNDDFTLPAGARLLGMLPHTHYLGRRVEAIAHRPDGRDEILLLIPEWDFRWQGDYVCREPVALPAGTRLEMRFTFDNSTNNVRNPFSPPRRVRFGPNTTDEMAELWFQLLPDDAAGAEKFRRALLDRTIRDVMGFNRQRLRLDPKDGTAHVNLGRAMLARRRNDQAFSHFTNAVAVAPDLDEAHYYLGITHRLAGRMAAAAHEFERVIQLNPGHSRAFGNLGVMHLEAGRRDVAAQLLSEAVRLDPMDPLAHASLGELRLQDGNAKEALPLLERAAELDPSDTDVRANLQRARQVLGVK